MRSSLITTCVLISFAALAGVVGCAADQETTGDRFTPGGADEKDLIQHPDAGDGCKAGVCPPKSKTPAAPDPAAAPPPSPDGGGAGPAATCGKPNLCSTAADLGTVRGDADGDTRTRQGSGSQFFSVDVTESSQGALGGAMKVAITLVSPKSSNYDLFVYETDCGTATHTSTQLAGVTDKIAFSWGDGYFSNNTDDKKTLRIEVRQVAETCDPSHEWTLLVAGNAN